MTAPRERTDLRCPECGRDYDDARPSCGLLHALTALQITVLRRMAKALFGGASR